MANTIDPPPESTARPAPGLRVAREVTETSEMVSPHQSALLFGPEAVQGGSEGLHRSPQAEREEREGVLQTGSSPQGPQGKKIDHLSNVGERTQISGTQNIDAKIFLFSSFSLNTCKGTDAAATAEPCSRPDVA